MHYYATKTNGINGSCSIAELWFPVFLRKGLLTGVQFLGFKLFNHLHRTAAQYEFASIILILLPCSSDCRLELHTGSRSWRACQALCLQIWGLKPQWSSRPCASSTSSGRWASVPAFLVLWSCTEKYISLRRCTHTFTLGLVANTVRLNCSLARTDFFSTTFSICFGHWIFRQCFPEVGDWSYEANIPWWLQGWKQNLVLFIDRSDFRQLLLCDDWNMTHQCPYIIQNYKVWIRYRISP